MHADWMGKGGRQSGIFIHLSVTLLLARASLLCRLKKRKKKFSQREQIV
jgi:hypothetical protein